MNGLLSDIQIYCNANGEYPRPPEHCAGDNVEGHSHWADVQNWVGYVLRAQQGRAYSVGREPHAADEKEPDIRLRAKASDANVAVEIKVAEAWTLKKLDEALDDQLCRRYLRAQDGRYGVLLLVHQHARPKGWEDTTTGRWLSFPEIVDRLSARAVTIAGAHHDSPQPEVCVLDVSGTDSAGE